MQKMKLFRSLLMLAVISMATVSCSNDDDPLYFLLKAADGRSIYVTSAVEQYNDESEFIDALSNVDMFGSTTDVKSGSTLPAERKTVYGYDEEPYLLNDIWQQVRFGYWCEQYGLVPGKSYLLNYKRITKYIPCTYDERVIEDSYLSTDRNMGYSKGRVGFVLDDTNDGGKYSAYTLVGVIGYDAEGNVINTHYPCNLDDLEWKYLVIGMSE